MLKQVVLRLYCHCSDKRNFPEYHALTPMKVICDEQWSSYRRGAENENLITDVVGTALNVRLLHFSTIVYSRCCKCKNFRRRRVFCIITFCIKTTEENKSCQCNFYNSASLILMETLYNLEKKRLPRLRAAFSKINIAILET